MPARKTAFRGAAQQKELSALNQYEFVAPILRPRLLGVPLIGWFFLAVAHGNGPVTVSAIF